MRLLEHYQNLLNCDTPRSINKGCREDDINLTNIKIMRKFSLNIKRISTYYQTISYYRKDFNSPLIQGIGFHETKDLSTKLSLLEAYERYSISYINKSIKMYSGSYAELINRYNVLNPNLMINKSLGYYKFNWVPCYSFKDKSLKLVPVDFVFCKDDLKFKSTSNGAAVGKNLIEALFFAILEIIERDSFLNCWYLKKPPKELDINTLPLQNCKRKIKQIRHMNYNIKIFCIETEFNLPTIWCLAHGLEETEFSHFTTTAVNLDLSIAIDKALNEMLYALCNYTDMKHIKEMGRQLLSGNVKNVSDHPILHSLPDMNKYYDFLRYCEKFNFLELSHVYSNDIINLKDKLFDIINDILELDSDLDVLLIDLSPTEQNLKAVKVIVPGLQPLWFGIQNKNISNKRLMQISKYWNLKHNTFVNCAVHPFP